MKRVKMLIFVIAVTFLFVSCSDWQTHSVKEESSNDIVFSKAVEEVSSVSSMPPVDIPSEITAVELWDAVTDEYGWYDYKNHDYDNRKIKVSGYLSGINVQRKELFVWFMERIGSFSFSFEELPDIDPLCNYVTIEGTCLQTSTVSFEDCTLISQETKTRETVYWEKGGKCIHFGNNCLWAPIILPDRLMAGTWDDAISNGCTMVCRDCLHTDDTPLNSFDNTVYWTAYGSKIHTQKRCPTLSSSDTVYEGDISEAHAAGLYDYCDRCTYVPDE